MAKQKTPAMKPYMVRITTDHKKIIKMLAKSLNKGEAQVVREAIVFYSSALLGAGA